VVTRAAIALIVAALLVGCSGESGSPSRPWFAEVTAEVGLPVEPWRPAPERHFMPDSLSGGGGFVDFDQDGDLDIYVVRSDGENRLYRQEPGGRFTDVSAQASAGGSGYGMGLAVGDVDNDGYPDLFVASYGPDVLLRNRGDGTFEDVTQTAGLGDPRWGSSAGFFDYDGDGFLDLYVANYVDFAPDRRTVDVAGRPEYPGPDCCAGVPDSLYHNRGNGTFEDVSVRSGIAAQGGKGLGVALLDLDGDRKLDVYVANDRVPNFAWMQRADGTFEDRAPAMGLAVNGFGDATASMGIAVGDADGDGHTDLLVTNLFGETNTLRAGLGHGQFEDRTAGSGLGPASFDFTGFGTAFFDPDLDGDLDLLVANGRVLRSLPRPGANLGPHWTPYAEENHFYENDGKGKFQLAEERCGPICATPNVGRGLALGDFDDDGDADVLLFTGDGRARLFRNVRPHGADWIGLRLVEGKRDALGAEVTITASGRSLRGAVAPASSYLVSHDPRVLLALGGATSVDEVAVRWPDGKSERFGPLAAGRYHVLVQGSGK
jgi:hypothetical protein